jgi:hypothetical protein
MGPLASRCGAITLAWNPSASPGVAGYNLCWGTNDGNYSYTNYYPGTRTIATISNLAPNQVYYFAVQAVGGHGNVSPFSNEEAFTNGPARRNPQALSRETESFPAFPPAPPGSGSLISKTNSPFQGAAGSSVIATPIISITQTTLWGVPPFLGMSASNGRMNLNINGTVGAALTIMSTTNDLSMDAWSALTNVTVSNIAAAAQTNQTGQPRDVLNAAFVPGTQSVAVAAANSPAFQYFRAVMSYDYIILAGAVLAGKGYTPRLIMVNMPGIARDDACYVNEASCSIHYARVNQALQMISSGSTIRQIATALANSLNLDWTSASEFVYTNGLGRILATVVETEPSSSDPVAGQNPPGPPFVVDF